MNDSPFEAALRASLKAAAPLEVPARLEDRASDIPAIAHPAQRWWSHIAPRTWGVAIAAALSLMIAFVLVVPRVVLGPGRGGPPNPVRIESAFGSLVASDLELTVDGRVFRVPPSATQAGVTELSLAGTATYGRLTVQWHDGATPMTLVMHFAADSHTWWVSEIVASDGRSGPSGWLYFEGPFFERPVGTSFKGSSDRSSVRSTYGATGSLQFGELSLSAFASGSPRNPTTGTMPPSDGASAASSGPDFIPMVGASGSQIVGYVSTAELDQPVPINSFRGQDPDQPVYGADLKTLVGYSVPGRGFEPLSASIQGSPPLQASSLPQGSILLVERVIADSSITLSPPGDVVPPISSDAAYKLCLTGVADCDPGNPTNIQLALITDPGSNMVQKDTLVWAISWPGITCPPHSGPVVVTPSNAPVATPGQSLCDKVAFVDARSGNFIFTVSYGHQ